MQSLINFFGNFYNKLISAFFEWVEMILGAIELVLQSLLDVYLLVINGFLNLVWYSSSYSYDLFLGEEGFIWYLFDVGIELGDRVLEAFPDIDSLLIGYQVPFDVVMNWMSALNVFFPVSEATFLLGIYLAFVGVVILVRIIIKAIPGEGG